MTVTAIFIAIGVLLAPFVSFPFGGARVFPLQHLINVLLSVLVGWRYSTAGAFCISSISIWGAIIGEIVGTGLLGGLIAYPVAAFVLDSKVVALWFFIVAFLPNTCIGAACGAVLYKVLPIRKFAEELRK